MIQRTPPGVQRDMVSAKVTAVGLLGVAVLVGMVLFWPQSASPAEQFWRLDATSKIGERAWATRLTEATCSCARARLLGEPGKAGESCPAHLIFWPSTDTATAVCEPYTQGFSPFAAGIGGSGG